MKLLRFLILLACIPAIGIAQPDFGSKSLSLPSGSGIRTPSATLPSSSSNSPSIFTPEKKTGTIEAPEINLNFGKPKAFANPNDNYKKQFDKIEMSVLTEDRRAFVANIKAHSGVIRLYYRDDGSIDGDMVKIYINGEVVKESLLLDGEYKGFTITLKKGYNKIEFEALNEGSSSPNTAEFEIYDEKGELMSHSNWAIPRGYMATVIVNN